MKYIKKFIELSKDDAHIAGGKGASLGEMLNANIPVPDGYVVTADTFDQFLSETDLTQELQAILTTVDTKAIHTVEHASEKIQAMIKSVEMPEDIATEVMSEFKELNAEYVAVRSSATAEDGADHAWAGQLDSYLNTTKENLLEMVQSCWASLFTPRAIFYRFEKGLHTTHISVAVVIQKMVNSEKSGIAFSVHPVTEDYNQIIIEAGLGLGEAIVSGSVTPDSYVVTKEPLEIIDTNVNTQNKALYRGTEKTEHGFNEWKDLSDSEANTQVLSKEQTLELSDIIVTIENHYDFPCDIEWAFENGTFYIVQSRPITTLKPILKESKVKFIKEYTRDYSYLIEEGWFEVSKNIFKEKFGLVNPHNVPVIFHSNDGVVEVWEHSESTEWLLDILQSQISENEEFIIKAIDTYEEELENIKKYWENPIFETKEEFLNFVNDVYKGMFNFDIMYYSGYDDRTPRHIRDRVLKIRDEDVYFDKNDTIIRENMGRLYPKSKGFETVVLFSELENIPDVEILKQRKQSSTLLGSEITLGTIPEFKSKNPEYNFVIEKLPEDKSTLNGEVGNKGYAKGIVRIMKRRDQMNELVEGEILVSMMTTPEFIPAMKKAAAIITDEGGITCHAGIVARELDKPCVIGTKFATQILKNGDLVEVDADNGIVRILKKTENSKIEIISKIKNLNWFKSWEAKSPLFLPTMGGPGYFKNIEEEFGFSLGHFLVTTKKGLLSGYWVEDEMKAFGNHVADLAIKNPELLTTWSERLKLETDICRELVSKDVNYFLDISNYQKLRHADEMLTAYQITVRDVINYLPDNIREEYMSDLEGARKYSETIFFELATIVDKVMNQIFEQEKYSRDILDCVTADELETYINDKKLPTEKILQERYNSSGYINHPEFTWLNEDEVKEIEQSFLSYSSHILKGQTAYEGNVTGTVRIIKDFSQSEDFIDGEILVTGMTDPNYVPIMKKAAAIVTDAGGLLCHAAIVSREMKVPCVVGTKIGTQILNDGDLVEVDANSGTIKVLNEESHKSEPFVFAFGAHKIAFNQMEAEMKYFIDHNFDYFSVENGLLYFYGNKMDAYFSNQDIKVRMPEFGNKYLDKNYFNNYLKSLENTISETRHYYRTIWDDTFTESTSDVLLDKYSEMYKHLGKLFGFLNSTGKESLLPLENLLQDKLKQVAVNGNDDFILLTTPEEMDEIKEEDLAWKKLVLLNNRELSDNQLLEHAFDYCWLFPDEISENKVIDFLNERLENISNTAELETEIDNIKKEHQEFKTKRQKCFDSHSSSIQELSTVISRLTRARMQVKFFYGINFVIRNLIHAIALYIKETPENIIYQYGIEDIEQSLKNSISLSITEMKNRKESKLLLIKNGKLKYFFGKDARDTAYPYLPQITSQGDDVIGSVANKGYARGNVYIVPMSDLDSLKKSDQEFKTGDILVTTMTQPNMVPIAKRASAIVTDQGGITCHAAIIARELGIPCVIGTDIATKVLKNGDLVEVNADDGIIKIIKE